LSELIGVTGATGHVGSRVADALARLGARQRLIVRDASRAPRLPGAEVVEVTDYGDRASFESAVKGVETLLLVSFREHRDRLRQHLAAVDAAVSAGVHRIVYTSFQGASLDCSFTLGRHHFATEEHLKAKGVAYTFLRDSLYLDFIPFIAGPDGVIRGPAGSGKFAPVARKDVASSAVAVLMAEGAHDGQSYDLTGPELISMVDAAQELSRVSGREITYIDETMEEAWESRRRFGAPDWEVEGWITSYVAIARGELGFVSDAVLHLTGRRAQSLPEFLAENPESYAHLTNART
jgi:NAD(P)H dehydrogenase (quinone)